MRWAGFCLFVEIQSVYATAPADSAAYDCGQIICIR